MNTQATTTTRQLNYSDLEQLYSSHRDDASIALVAAPVLEAIVSRANEYCSALELDRARMPLVGKSLYREAIDGRFTGQQLAAALQTLKRRRANVHLIDTIATAPIA